MKRKTMVKQFNDDILIYLFFNCLLINFLFSNILITVSEKNTSVEGNLFNYRHK